MLNQSETWYVVLHIFDWLKINQTIWIFTFAFSCIYERSLKKNLGKIKVRNYEAYLILFHFTGSIWLGFGARIEIKHGCAMCPQCDNHLVHLLKLELFWSRPYNLSLILTPSIRKPPFPKADFLKLSIEMYLDLLYLRLDQIKISFYYVTLEY